MKWLIYSAMLMFAASVTCVSVAETPAFGLTEDENQITIRQRERVLLSYNKRPPELPPDLDPSYLRSGFLHPVASPQGRVVTAAYPADHAHQNGIFNAWVQTKYDGRPVDFWNLAKGQGRVKHARVLSTFCGPASAGFAVELVHQTTGASPDGQTPVDVLRETWRVTCIQSSDHVVFDLESVQEAITAKPLFVERYHYGGMAVRGPADWRLRSEQPEGDPLPSDFVNSQGAGRIEGNHQTATWVAMTGHQDGKPVTIAVLSHPDNFRAPQPARIHPTMPYFCFAPCVSGSFTIDQQHPLRARYRYLVTDDVPDTSWLDDQWQAWCEAEQQTSSSQNRKGD